MVKKLLNGLAVPLVLLGSCSGDESLECLRTDSDTATKCISLQRESIERYIEKNKKLTRGEGYTVTPYIEGGDTLMYIVDYRAGWEVFSNSFNMPMSLLKSETGNFSDFQSNANPAIKCLFDQIKELLRSENDSPLPQAVAGYEEWFPYSNSSLSSGSGPVDPPGGEALYTLVGQKENSHRAESVPHLITTHWHQEDPMNRFMPFQQFNTDEHISVGCTAVAVGQFLYYANNKWGLQTNIPSKATYSSIDNEYTFSDFSYSQYSKMLPYYFSVWDGDDAPLFLAWIAKCIGARPRYEKGVYKGTEASFESGKDFINEKTAYNAQVKEFSNYEAAQMVIKGKPVPLWLYNNDGGHVVVLDAVYYSETNIDYYYAYVVPGSGSGNTGGDPTMPPGPSTSPGSDYGSLVAQYGQIFTENRTEISTSFKFNWGWGFNSNDDVWINGNIINITIKNIQGAEENLTLRTHKMISYTAN